MSAVHRLAANAVKTAEAGKHCDGGGLWLVKHPDRRGKWVLRYTIPGRRGEMGLGSLSEVPLRQARERAARQRALVTEGKDPSKCAKRRRARLPAPTPACA